MPHLNVLAGDTVTWHNASLRAHDVAADDRSWASPRLLMDAMFEHRFDAPGTYAYLCRLHPTMRGDIAVHRLLLDAAKEPAAPGKPYALKGRAALPEGATVSIQADGVEQTTATVDAGGAFTATVTPSTTASYTAVAGAESAPPVQVLVLDRKVSATQKVASARLTIDAKVTPGIGRRHRRAAAQAQGALRLVAGAGGEDERRRHGALHRRPRPQGAGPGAAHGLRRGDRARAQRHVPPTLGGMPRILVVGGGAIGGITAAGLAADVVVLDANEAHAAKLNDPGLVINDAAPVKVEAVTSVDQLEGEFDFALIAVKSPLHAVVIPPLVERGEIEAFVTLGNGLIQDRIEAMVGEGNLLACLVEWGGSNVGPGELIRDSEGGYVVGELDGVLTDRARRLAKALQPIGTTRVTDNVRGMIWTKLQVNSTFTGLSAVSGLRYGGVAEQGPDAVYALWEEGVQVARAQGLELGEMHDVHAYEFGPRRARADDGAHGQRAARRCCRTSTPAARPRSTSSTAAWRARAASCGIPTPHNDAVVELVHSMERGERAPDPKYLDYVSAAQITSAADS